MNSMPIEQNRTSPLARKGSLGRTIKAVAWSFIGLRKGSEYQEDIAKLNPLHLIAVALVGVIGLVVGLIVLVNTVVGG